MKTHTNNPVLDDLSWINSKSKALQDILSKSASMIFFKDLKGRYIFANKTFAKLFNSTEKNIIGKTDFKLLDHESAEKEQGTLIKIILPVEPD